MKINHIISLALLILSLGCITACVRVGEMEEESQKIPLDNSESADVNLKMSAGELRIQGGTSELMEGYFQYNIKRWKPEVDYHLIGSQGVLTVEQRRSSGIPLGSTRNRWEINLNNHLSLDLELNFGAGEAKLDLNELQVKRLDIHMGVGDLTLDLKGERKFNLDGTIKGGIGHAAIFLPRSIGVRVKIDGGLGSVHAPDFLKTGEIYTNEAYGKTAVTIDLSIKAGIGSIDLTLR